MIRADDLQCNGLTLLQDDELYRFTTDAVLLADFVRVRREGEVLDFGTGSGILALLIAEKRPSVRVTGVEIQPELYRLAVKNTERNALCRRVEMVLGDVCEYVRTRRRPADAVVCNPPYFRRGSSFRNESESKARARHEVDLDLPSLCRAAFSGLKSGGDLFLCYPADRIAELCFELHANRLEVKELRAVCAKAGMAPHLFLVRARREGAVGVKNLPPLYLDGEEVGRIYGRTNKEELE